MFLLLQPKHTYSRCPPPPIELGAYMLVVASRWTNTCGWIGIRGCTTSIKTIVPRAWGIEPNVFCPF